MRLGGRTVRFLAVMNFDAKDHPYILDTDTGLVGCVYPVDYRDSEIIDQTLEDIAQGRRLRAKVRGYSIFIDCAGHISGERLSEDEMYSSLCGMAVFFRDTIIAHKPGRYERNLDGYYPGMPGTWRPNR